MERGDSHANIRVYSMKTNLPTTLGLSVGGEDDKCSCFPLSMLTSAEDLKGFLDIAHVVEHAAHDSVRCEVLACAHWLRVSTV